MLRLIETLHLDFSEQYRRLAVVDESRIILAGGNDPITGRRSQFSSELRCLDVSSGSTLWSQSYPRNHPFWRPVIAGEVVAVARELNFVRTPTGVFSFRLGDGSPEIDHAVTGLKGLSADASSGRLFYAFESDGRFGIGTVDHESSSASIHLPYSNRGLSLVDIHTVSTDRFVVIFGTGGRYTHELWSFSESRPIWKCASKCDRCVLRHDRLLTFSWSPEPRETVKIGQIDIATGRSAELGTLLGAGISNLHLLDDEVALWINHDRQLGYTDLSSGKSAMLVQLNAECPGWVDVAILRAPNRVVTLNANNFTNPRAELKVFAVE